MKFRSDVFAFLLVSVLLFTGCSSNSGSSSDSSYIAENSKEVAVESGVVYEDSGYDGIESEEYAEENDMEDDASNELSDASGLYDKLVYTGTVSVDTLKFDESVAALKTLIKEQKGFVENETFSDGDYYEYDYSYVSESKKRKRYSATIRIPSKKYDTVMDSVGTLGDVRSKNSSTENFSQEYSDLSIKLDILQQTYDRYSALMEGATDEEYILELMNRMQELQVQIEQTKSRMNRIDTDVAFSFINITIREVYKYEDHPTTPDTFLSRLKDTLEETWVDFLDFLENLLFLLIRLLPYVVVIGFVVVIVRKIMKKHSEKHPKSEDPSAKQKKKLSILKKGPFGKKGANGSDTTVMPDGSDTAVMPKGSDAPNASDDSNGLDSSNASSAGSSDGGNAVEGAPGKDDASQYLK